MKTYSSSRFARHTGVTIKMLRHYERLGLVVPQRTDSGHRRYALAHVQQLERVLALKSLGLPLVRIKPSATLDAPFLRAHRARLEEKRAALERAIEAVHVIEQAPLIGEALNRFIGDAAWSRWETN